MVYDVIKIKVSRRCKKASGQKEIFEMINDPKILEVVGNNAAYRTRLKKCSIVDGKCVGCKGCGFYPPCKIKQTLDPDAVRKY